MTEHSEMLALAAQELLDWYNSGELKQNGVFKKYADGLVDVPERMRLRVAENNIHNEALRLAATTGTAVGREAVASKAAVNLIARLIDGYAGKRPFPFNRIDLGPVVAPVYAVNDHDLKLLVDAAIRALPLPNEDAK